MRLRTLPLWFVMLLAGSGSCVAQTTIHHCTSANGTPVFTDQPCSSVGATVTAAPTTATAPATATGDALAPGGPRGPQHCPLDVADLKRRVAATFRASDANALAGLMLWHGYGERGAIHSVKQLAQLMRWPFQGFAQVSVQPVMATSAGLPPLWPPAAHAAPAAQTAQTAHANAHTLTLKLGNPARPRVSFHIVRRDTCLWLEP